MAKGAGMDLTCSKWIDFLRKYGPIPRNDNMYDEAIQRYARRHGCQPIVFDHPFAARVAACVERCPCGNVILTGTAGDGKTHLCREAWERLNGDRDQWASDDPCISLVTGSGQTVHFVRDLSGWAPPMGAKWSDAPGKTELFCGLVSSCLGTGCADAFVLAGNDGQLIEALRRLSQEVPSEDVQRFRQVVEELLVEDRSAAEGVNLELLNLSRSNSADLFDRACDALLAHEGWTECLEDCEIGADCPVRANYALLSSELVRGRLRKLLELCDHSGLHLPVRQILLLLTNALLGHPQAKDYLLRECDIQGILASGTRAEGCLYSNVFGGNLPERRRLSLAVFDFLDRLQIGAETTNRIDNLIIFGEDDETARDDYQSLIASDTFFSCDEPFKVAKRRYIEAADEDEEASSDFLAMLTRYRRGMFFRIPAEEEGRLHLWDLSVFHFAGEYTSEVCAYLADRTHVIPRRAVARLVKGLNRIFTGMMLDSDEQLCLAVSGGSSQTRVGRIYLDSISVRPQKGERIGIDVDQGGTRAVLRVWFSADDYEDLRLSLVRYEFLSRVAEDGALPASFSRECNEDILAFKSRLVSHWTALRGNEDVLDDGYAEVRLLRSADGRLDDRRITIRR